MKDSTGSFERHEGYLDATRDRDFELYIGSEPLVLRAYREGAADAAQAEIATAKADVESEGSTVAAVKRRVAAQVAGYPAAPRAPFA